MKNEIFSPLNFAEKPVEEMITASRSFYENVKRRRSVREFSDRSIPIEVIENAIRAAGTAPSGANMQPWHFVVVTDPAKKREIRVGAEIEEKAFYHGRAPEEGRMTPEPVGVRACPGRRLSHL